MAYAVEYFFEYYDIGGTVKHEVELLLLNYSGGSTRIDYANISPVHVRHVGSQSKFEETIIQGQELTFSFEIARADVATFDSIFESDYKDYKLRYTVDGQVEFEGYIKPENLIKQYLKTPPFIPINLSATDALVDLKKIEFLDSNGSPINDTITLLDIIKYALDPLGIELQIQVQLGTYESTYMVSTECALKEIKIDTRRFFINVAGKQGYMSCWEVIEWVLKDYNVLLKQNKGKYQITCPYELDSYQFLYDWTTLTQQSRSVTSNVVDVSSYKVKPSVNEQKIRPLKTAGITFKNKDLGGNITGFDLDAWATDPPWQIDFSNSYTVASGVVTLKSNNNAYDEFIELAPFNVSKVTDYDYLKVSFDHILSAHTSADPLKSPLIKITVTRPDATTEDTYFNFKENWESYESPITQTFKVISTGNYEIKLSFLQAGGPWTWTTAEFQIKNFMVTKVINPAEGSDWTDITFDEYYRQESGKGFEVFETDILLADVGQITEVGAFLFEDSAEHITEAWRTYGHTEDIKLVDIYARRILDNRYAYKNLLKRVTLFDRDNNIDFNTILTIDSRNYVFLSYDRNFEIGSITADLMEILTTQQSYDDIQRTGLNSINGEVVVVTANVNLSPPSSIAHNDTTGLNTGNYQHLTAAQDTDLTDGGDCSIHKHDDRYYTETELNNGQLDSRYYTETEVNTWRNSVTQAEMGYLHGVSSDVQTQITARAIISGTPVDNQIAVWTGATSIEGTNNLVFTATGLGIGTVSPSGKLNVVSTQAGYYAAEIENSNVDGHGVLIKVGNVDSNRGALVVENSVSQFFYVRNDGNVGINDASPTYLFDVNGIGRFTGNLYGDANVQHLSFATGWQGTNWEITAAGYAEFDSMKIRGGLQVYELILNRLHYQCGGLIIGAGGGKVSVINVATVGSEQLTFEDPEGNVNLPFTVGAIVMLQDFDLDRTTLVKRIYRQVASIATSVITFTTTAGAPADTGIFALGDEVVAIGHVSNTALDSNIYMSAVDSNNPFIRVFDGVSSYAKWSLSDKTTIKLQLGNLESLASYDIVPASPGYGLYSSNVYLTGKIVATSGYIGTAAAGWTIESDAIYTGEKHTGDDWNVNSAGGITLSGDGSIHATDFYVNADGSIGLREVESVLFKADVGGSGTKILGASIWEHVRDIENSSLSINVLGYNGGATRYRTTIIGDGKAHHDFQFIGALVSQARFDAKMKIGSDAAPSYTLDVYADDATSYAASFFNDGDNVNRYGVLIQCGVDAPGVAGNYPVYFADGNGDLVGTIRWDNTTIELGYLSDVQLKENIKDYNIDGLSIIEQMQYRAFNWKKDKDKLEIHGFIADEVELIYPDMVSVDPKSGYKMIAPARLIPVMMAAIKELNTKVTELESQIK